MSKNSKLKPPPPPANNWPFPPPGGPVPWTAQQVAEHARQQRAQLPAAPF